MVHIASADEDPAVKQEREAVQAIERKPFTTETDFTLEDVVASTGELRDALLSLPYGNGSSYFQKPGYFVNVQGFARTFDFIAGRLGGPPGGRLLDIGADLTWSTARLAARGWRPVGTDINHHLPASAVFQRHGPAYAVANVDMHVPAFGDEVFDVVTAFNALHHTHRLPDLVANIARVLKPGGKLGFVEPYWYHEAVRDAFGRDEIDGGINENVHSLEEWHQTLVNAGLELVVFLISHSYNAIYRKQSVGAVRRTINIDEAREELFARHYYVRFLAPPVIPGLVPANQTIHVPVIVLNEAQAGWSSEGQIPVFLSYHLHRVDGDGTTLVAFDNPRTPLPGYLEPASETEVILPIGTPAEPGEYVATVDLVHEARCWFFEKGGSTAGIRFRVRESSG